MWVSGERGRVVVVAVGVVVLGEGFVGGRVGGGIVVWVFRPRSMVCWYEQELLEGGLSLSMRCNAMRMVACDSVSALSACMHVGALRDGFACDRWMGRARFNVPTNSYGNEVQ